MGPLRAPPAGLGGRNRMEVTLMRTAYSIALAVMLLGALRLGALQQEKSEFKYLPDHPGKAGATISLPLYTEYRLSPAERSAFVANLTRFRDLLLAQPSFHPPRGIDVTGHLGGGAPRFVLWECETPRMVLPGS